MLPSKREAASRQDGRASWIPAGLICSNPISFRRLLTDWITKGTGKRLFLWPGDPDYVLRSSILSPMLDAVPKTPI